jgi:hypothetical protein
MLEGGEAGEVVVLIAESVAEANGRSAEVKLRRYGWQRSLVVGSELVRAMLPMNRLVGCAKRLVLGLWLATSNHICTSDMI